MTEAREPLTLRLDRHLGSGRDSVALSFKVSFKFRRWFKLHALQRNLTMTEFLVEAVEDTSPRSVRPRKSVPTVRKSVNEYLSRAVAGTRFSALYLARAPVTLPRRQVRIRSWGKQTPTTRCQIIRE